jgi:acetyl esterase/lipase
VNGGHTLLFNVKWRGARFNMTLRSTTIAKQRRRRAFLPPTVTCLEQRALLSGFTATRSAPDSPSGLLSSRLDPSTAAPPSWTENQNVSFPTVNGQTESLDVYTPDSPAPVGGYPVMVAIHGGGWHALDKSQFGRRTARVFTQDGYVVVAPNYVLSSPGNPTWPVNFEDVQAAVRWVRGNATSMDFNANEIVAEGESAGANLAALLGVYSPESQGTVASSAVDAVVAVSTPADLTALYFQTQFAGHLAAQFLGGTPANVRANYIAASPIDHVSPGDPPMLLIHGRQDNVIPVSQSERMHDALTDAGVRNELILVQGGHGLDFPAHYSNLVPNVLEFLATTWNY